jgi:hypothetical protein
LILLLAGLQRNHLDVAVVRLGSQVDIALVPRDGALEAVASGGGVCHREIIKRNTGRRGRVSPRWRRAEKRVVLM